MSKWIKKFSVYAVIIQFLTNQIYGINLEDEEADESLSSPVSHENPFSEDELDGSIAESASSNEETEKEKIERETKAPEALGANAERTIHHFFDQFRGYKDRKRDSNSLEPLKEEPSQKRPRHDALNNELIPALLKSLNKKEAIYIIPLLGNPLEKPGIIAHFNFDLSRGIRCHGVRYTRQRKHSPHDEALNTTFGISLPKVGEDTSIGLFLHKGKKCFLIAPRSYRWINTEIGLKIDEIALAQMKGLIDFNSILELQVRQTIDANPRTATIRSDAPQTRTSLLPAETSRVLQISGLAKNISKFSRFQVSEKKGDQFLKAHKKKSQSFSSLEEIFEEFEKVKELVDEDCKDMVTRMKEVEVKDAESEKLVKVLEAKKRSVASTSADTTDHYKIVHEKKLYVFDQNKWYRHLTDAERVDSLKELSLEWEDTLKGLNISLPPYNDGERESGYISRLPDALIMDQRLLYTEGPKYTVGSRASNFSKEFCDAIIGRTLICAKKFSQKKGSNPSHDSEPLGHLWQQAQVTVTTLLRVDLRQKAHEAFLKGEIAEIKTKPGLPLLIEPIENKLRDTWTPEEILDLINTQKDKYAQHAPIFDRLRAKYNVFIGAFPKDNEPISPNTYTIMLLILNSRASELEKVIQPTALEGLLNLERYIRNLGFKFIIKVVPNLARAERSS